ncbi:MAG: glycosyltransferase [Candidatus Koribacter versatilis]|uniref:Glycosyltransferase n=1 Tax=Candidatus Korobacter versatilis TaxID=658062 RepID=A0A932A9W8_9BACT|nr:glycosyltransferase [Candidatus Koribacter versatilis]
MHSAVLHFFDYVNAIILVYFLVTNVVYTVLMVFSLYTVSMHAKSAAHGAYADLLESPVTPPVALIVPAHNEEDAIVQTVMSLLEIQYPEKEVIVVDDGSTDGTVDKLVQKFHLLRMDLIYRPQATCKPVFAFYFNPERPELILISKENGGKADALNAGINMARSPYFCTVDADSIIEPQALLRLMAPVVESTVNTIVSGGVVRIANGCTLRNGRIVDVNLPKTWLERCQVVEYIRTFLFGRPGWNFLNATFICSGAFCLLHRETVLEAGGFSRDTVTEDIDIIATLHRFCKKNHRQYRMVFTTDPICWTEAPHTVGMLARQRRRWQLGLMQTVMKHNDMIFSPRYGMMGLASMPFHAYVEALGCVIEAFGTILIPFTFLVGAMPFSLFLLLMFLAFGYGTLLSVGSVLLEETTLRRYPKVRDVLMLVLFAMIENVGYRQMVTLFRAQGVIQYFTGLNKWELVVHKGFESRVLVEDEV